MAGTDASSDSSTQGSDVASLAELLRETLVYETPHVGLPDEVDLPDRYRPYLWRM